jgi:hypothetical protein
MKMAVRKSVSKKKVKHAKKKARSVKKKDGLGGGRGRIKK